MSSTMRAARLHGVGDLRVETLPVPAPGPRELLVRVEACGICPTDARKFAIGTSTYPLNPGHEWAGRVVAVGEAAEDWRVGDRVYGDTYAGYAEYATIATAPSGWSHGALALGDVPLERAVFVEPLADCLHCVRDQGAVRPGTRVAVLGLGAMGVQMAAVAARAGADLLVVEPREERRALAARLGAPDGAAPDAWCAEAAARWDGAGPEVVILTVPRAALAAEAIEACAPGGRVVLFAGFGDDGIAPVDLNRIHYEEIALVGSEWVGTPPRQRLEHYAAARDLLASGELPLEELVSDRTGLDGVADALQAVRDQRSYKTVLLP